MLKLHAFRQVQRAEGGQDQVSERERENFLLRERERDFEVTEREGDFLK